MQATIAGYKQGKIAYELNPKYWGLGYATEACKQIIKFLSTECEVTEIIAEVDTRNEASYKLLERLSFERVKTKARADYFKGSYSDEYVYRLKTDAV